MGRTAKTVSQPNKQAAAHKTKKNKNVFKVNTVKTKTKKPKEVQGKLKKIKDVITTKQEKADASLKALHKDMVVKKPNFVAPASKTPAVAKKPKKAPANTKNVSNKLGGLKV